MKVFIAALEAPLRHPKSNFSANCKAAVHILPGVAARLEAAPFQSLRSWS
jgi:hypothetical protein